MKRLLSAYSAFVEVWLLAPLTRRLRRLGGAVVRWGRIMAWQAAGAILGGALTVGLMYVIFFIVKATGGAG